MFSTEEIGQRNVTNPIIGSILFYFARDTVVAWGLKRSSVKTYRLFAGLII